MLAIMILSVYAIGAVVYAFLLARHFDWVQGIIEDYVLITLVSLLWPLTAPVALTVVPIMWGVKSRKRAEQKGRDPEPEEPKPKPVLDPDFVEIRFESKNVSAYRDGRLTCLLTAHTVHRDKTVWVADDKSILRLLWVPGNESAHHEEISVLEAMQRLATCSKN